ncbi:MAG: hypothetical protein KAX25_01800 [Dehalococcoidia bacterium]|nr:hypothetical protein [Dehalococcoidia bacterium]
MAKGTRITVDLGDEELLKGIKFAAVEQGKPVRQIVIEALGQWLERTKSSGSKDFQAMIRALSDYRKDVGQASG